MDIVKDKNLRSLSQKELENCFSDLLIKEPFFAYMGIQLPRIITEDVPTAAVGKQTGGRLSLFVNPKFFLNELSSRGERIAVLKHELLHIVFQHVLRLEMDKKNSTQFNYAADLVVNQFIHPWTLPDSGVTIKSMRDMYGLNLEEDRSLEYYYNKIQSLFDEQENDLSLGRHSFHGLWENEKSSGGYDRELQREISGVLETAIRKNPHAWGDMPSDLKRHIQESIQAGTSTKNWKSLLRIFLSSNGRTRIRYTMKKISKRYGTRPGIKVQRLKHIAIALDTSGSINEKLFMEFFKEIKSLRKTGAKITILECDSKIQKVYEFKGSISNNLSGGGGTDFDPVFEWARTNKNKLVDGIIYFTDGYADKPKVKPQCPVLWLIYDSEKSKNWDFGFGRVVVME